MHLITMYILNEHLGFGSLLLYLFDFVHMDLFVVSAKCCHPCVQSVCTLKAGGRRTVRLSL